jgi:hypothetical protein
MTDFNDNIQEKKINNFRKELPAKTIDRSQIGLWQTLKQFVGKDFTRIVMPAAW